MDDVRELLDGEVERRASGFDCATAERVLYIPFSLTRDPAQALLVCRQSGLLRAKLDAMDRDTAHLLYQTTVI
jgi:hypothetical protein